jgi:hypothetical protein
VTDFSAGVSENRQRQRQKQVPRCTRNDKAERQVQSQQRKQILRYAQDDNFDETKLSTDCKVLYADLQSA